MEIFGGADRLVFHFDEGESLLDLLLAEADEASAISITGSGTLTNLEVEEGDGVQRKVGAVEAVSITGIVLRRRIDLFGTFVRGTQLFGGRIVSATVRRAVLTGELVTSQQSTSASTSSAPKKRSQNPSSLANHGVSKSVKTKQVKTPSTVPASTTTSTPTKPTPLPASSGWEAAFQAAEQAEQKASAKSPKPSPKSTGSHLSRPPARNLSALTPKSNLKSRKKKASIIDEPMPEVGDWVEHRQFGLCEVRAVDGDGGLTITPQGGRSKRIKLTVLRAEEPRIEGNRVIYPLVKR